MDRGDEIIGDKNEELYNLKEENEQLKEENEKCKKMILESFRSKSDV